MIQTKQVPKRITWADYAKGIAIFTVVLWHVVGGVVNGGIPVPAGLNSWALHWDIYIHRFMPIFFVLSGAFAVKSANKPVRVSLDVRLRKIVYPYFLWSLITLVVGTILVRYTNHGVTLADAPQMFYAPIMHYWFLYALFFISLAYLVFDRFNIGRWWFLVFTTVLYIFGEAINLVDRSYILGQIAFFAIYYALGVAFSPLIIRRLVSLSTQTLAATAIITTVVSLPFFFVGESLLWLRLLPATTAMIAGTALSVLLARANTLGFLKVWGRYSLEIYLAHVLALAATRIALSTFLGVQNA